VLLFGGVDEKERQVGGYGMFDSEVRTEYENVHLNDVHVLDLRTLHWTRLNVPGEGPFGGLKATSTVGAPFASTGVTQRVFDSQQHQLRRRFETQGASQRESSLGLGFRRSPLGVSSLSLSTHLSVLSSATEPKADGGRLATVDKSRPNK